MWRLLRREAKVGRALAGAHIPCHRMDTVELASHLLLDFR